MSNTTVMPPVNSAETAKPTVAQFWAGRSQTPRECHCELNGTACTPGSQRNGGAKARSEAQCGAFPRTVAMFKLGQALKASIKCKPSFTTLCAKFNQCQRGQSCQSTSALTLPSRGRVPAYGLHTPLMSNVGPRRAALADCMHGGGMSAPVAPCLDNTECR